MMEPFQCMYAVYALALCTAVQQIAAQPEVETNPSSILVPIGTIAVFECRVHQCPRTCSVYWIINGTSTAHDHQQDQHKEQGFVFSHQRNTTTDVYTGRISISASAGVNNTVLCCLIQDGRNPSRKSDQATLLVIAAPTLMPNPSARIQNSTSFLLEFSPPFLWPGQHIEYFIIKVINVNDGIITRYVVNSTSTDVVVLLTGEQQLDASDLTVCACTELLFIVFAVGPDSTELSSFNVTGRYLSSCSMPEFSVAGVNTSILFTNKMIPIVDIIIKLPMTVCVHQVVNYSISIIDKSASESNNSINYTYISYNGPYFHIGGGIVSQSITSGLERDKEYSAVVNIGTESQMIHSNEVFFSTVFEVPATFTHCINASNEGANTFYYKLSTGLSLTLAVFIQLILTAMVILKCTRYTRRKCNESGTSMVCDDGPQYESVQSPILNEGFEVLTPGVLHATNTSICTPSCKTNDHLQLVTTAVQRT